MYKLVGSIGILLIVVIGIWYKFHTLNDIIDVQKDTIAERDKNITDTQKTIDNLNLRLLLKDGDIKNLQGGLNACNDSVNKIKIDNEANLKDYQNWANQTAEAKYKSFYKKLYYRPNTDHNSSTVNTDNNGTIDYSKGNCADGLYLNKVISGLKYEDL